LAGFELTCEMLFVIGPVDELVLLLLLMLLVVEDVFTGDATLAVDVAVGLDVMSLTEGGRSAW
jgi:hypothetical protein